MVMASRENSLGQEKDQYFIKVAVKGRGAGNKHCYCLNLGR